MLDTSQEDAEKKAEQELHDQLVRWYLDTWDGLLPSPPYRAIVIFCAAHHEWTPEHHYHRLKEIEAFAVMNAQSKRK